MLKSENSKQEERIRDFEKKREKEENPGDRRNAQKEEIEILKKSRKR